MEKDQQDMITADRWYDVPCSVLTSFLGHLRRAHVADGGSEIVLREDIRRTFRQFVKDVPASQRRELKSTLGKRIAQTEEVIFNGTGACIVLREEPGNRRAFLAGQGGDAVKLLNKRQLLGLRESIILGQPVPEYFTFGIDFTPFRIFPDEAGETFDIGAGPVRVGGLLQQEVRQNPRETLSRCLDFLGGRRVDGQPLLFSSPPNDIPVLRERLGRALSILSQRPLAEAIDKSLPDLQLLGFAAGWGNTTRRALETLGLFQDLLLDPTSEGILELFNRLPLARRVLLVSVHGWFAQADVLGRPDTGGQVVYVLDQARALEHHLTNLWREAGLDVKPEILILTRLIPEAEGTTCDQRKELVRGTENTHILRVPFRNRHGEVEPRWMSRFQVWPYLDRFAHDAYHEIATEFDGHPPDQIVGNYTDGNLVASVLGREWQVPIAVIAHALEKTKYLMSDLYWQDLEHDYRFSIHFLSDILAANSADFIITSSYQEIAGTAGELGQYESYEVFTLPERYRVMSGVNVKSARFVINPPGVDPETYHSYTDQRGGDPAAEQEIEEIVFGEEPVDAGIRGQFENPDKPIIFTMARMDKIKNLTGLVQVYAKRPALREAANLLILSGVTQFEESQDIEERQQIERMYRYFDQYDLHSSVRWLPGRLGQHLVPHYYRLVARRRGVFVQPALFEAFGLTVLEAMASGLPVVATRFGGPASIIEDGVSGHLIDPNRAAEVEKAVLAVLRSSANDDEDPWEAMSHAGIRRVQEHFSWPGHARRLVSSYSLYSLWSHIFPERRAVRRSYVDALHNFLLGRLIDEAWPE